MTRFWKKPLNRGITIVLIFILLGLLGFIIVPAVTNIPSNILSSYFRLKFFGPQIIPSTLYYPTTKGMNSFNEYFLTLNPAGTSLGNKEIAKAILLGPRGKLEVQVAWPDLRIKSLMRIILPAEKLEQGKITLNLPMGTNHFTQLLIDYVNGEKEQFFIGNLIWEIVSPERAIIVGDPKAYSFWRFSEASLNPFYLVYFQNNTSRNLILKGLHFPAELSYTLDLSSFSYEKGVRNWGPYPDYSGAHPWSYKIISQKNTLFPSPISLEPGEGVTLFFSLAPTSSEAGRMLKSIGLALETYDDQILLTESGILDGLENWSLPELPYMLWRP
jgi:hypothetical protein